MSGPADKIPGDVATARQLWWVVIGLGVVQLAASMVEALGLREEFTADILEQARTTDPQLTSATAGLMVSMAFVMVGIIGVVVAVVAAVIVHQLGRGKIWARTVMTFAGVWLVFMAIGTMFALDAVSGAASLVAGAASIVQGVLAAGAIYLCYRPESARYFQRRQQ